MAVPGKRSERELSSTVNLISQEAFSLVCEPCHRDDQSVPAYGYCADCKEHLCESCFKHHRRATLSRHHILLDKDSMPHSQQLSSATTTVGSSDDFTTPCPKHKKEVIKFYCHDHKTLICNVCVTLEHTVTSCKVSYIPDISEQAVDSEEYKNNLRKINSLTEKCQNVTEDLKKIMTKSNNSAADLLMAVETVRREINQQIDKIEEEAKYIAKTIKKENNERTKSTETTFGIVTKSLKESADNILRLNASKQADKLFMELKTAEKVIQDQEKRISDTTTSENFHVKIYQFKPNQAISDVLETRQLLGTISYKTETYSGTAAYAESTQRSTLSESAPPCTTQSSGHQGRTKEIPRQPSHLAILPVKSPQDTHRCLITGMVLLPPDRLCITDWNNESIKMFHAKTLSLICQLQFATTPFGIDSVNSNVLLVTQPHRNRITFISASSDWLTEKHCIYVPGKCSGISYYNDQLVVSFQDPGKLQILNMKGLLQTTVETTARGERMFVEPDYIKTNSKSIYVSDTTTGITRLNWQGQVTGRYKKMGCPRGLFLRDETVFVCDSDGRKNHIQEISSDCTDGKVVLKDLTKPYAVCYCGTENKLYISSYTSEDKYNNFIHVYKI